MEFVGILFSLLFAAILTALFSLAFKNTGPWSGFWMFFILLFFVSLGAGEWAAHRGPSAWGYYWAPGLLAAIIFALVLAAASPKSTLSQNKKTKPDTKLEAPVEEEMVVVSVIAGIFFWILILALIIIAISGLFFNQ
ncbi:MAG: hypothetical protein V4663_11735 [Bacteroidota bacterium]